MKLKEYPISFFKSLALSVMQFRQMNIEPLDCIVSLTSIEPRFGTLHLTIKSVMQQSRPPKKIILWVDKKHEGKLPKSLTRLKGEQFDIRFVEDKGSHSKLIYALAESPQSVIVTCDDDLMYPKNWLSNIYSDHLAFPNDIISNECRVISYNNGELLPYRDWLYTNKTGVSENNFLLLGYSGVLYPPRSLHKDTCDDKLFKILSPKADDLWFNAMAMLNNTKIRKCSTPPKKPLPIIGAAVSRLSDDNIANDQNRAQWVAICNHYDIKPN